MVGLFIFELEKRGSNEHAFRAWLEAENRLHKCRMYVISPNFKTRLSYKLRCPQQFPYYLSTLIRIGDNELRRQKSNTESKWRISRPKHVKAGIDPHILSERNKSRTLKLLQRFMQERSTSYPNRVVAEATWGIEWCVKERRNWLPKRWPLWRSTSSNHWISTKFCLTGRKKAVTEELSII